MGAAPFADEEIEIDGIVALRRLLVQLRVREIIVPLRVSAATAYLGAICCDEPGWLDWALADAGLPSARVPQLMLRVGARMFHLSWGTSAG
jgi:hypothetical protein